MRIVVDTNVLVSGMINPHGPPGRIVDLLRSGVVELVVDDRIVAEYAEVLRRPYLRRYFTEADADDVMEYLRRESIRISSRVVVSKLSDSGDAPFLEVALTAGVPLVTGNVRHFPESKRRGCEVVEPGTFVRKLP